MRESDSICIEANTSPTASPRECARGDAVGDVPTVCTDVKGRHVEHCLKDVHYVQTGRSNLLSLECLEQDGWSVMLSGPTEPRKCWPKRDDVTLE